MAIINFENMKATEPDRNFDNVNVDENYNIGLQNGQGFYGAGKFFGLVQKAVNWISTITGNKNFTGTLSVNSKEVATTESVNNALTNYQKMGEYTFKLPPTTETTYLNCPIRNNATDGMIDWYLRSNKDNQIWSIKVTSWYRTEGQNVPAVAIKSNASRGLNITEIKGLYNSYWGGCQIALAIPPHSEEIELSTFCIHKGRIFIPSSFILLSDISSFTTVATKTITTGFNA